MDDVLKAMRHYEAAKMQVSDSEVITTAFVSVLYATVQRKSNSKRKDEPYINFLKEHMRKEIETDFSQIKVKMLRNIHAVTQPDF